MPAAAIASCLLLQSPPAARPARPADPWAPVRFLIGEWTGESEGEPGKGAVTRTYRFVLGDRFIHARESYRVVSPDEFVETFELAADGKTFSVYSLTRFTRARRP